MSDEWREEWRTCIKCDGLRYDGGERCHRCVGYGVERVRVRVQSPSADSVLGPTMPSGTSPKRT